MRTVTISLFILVFFALLPTVLATNVTFDDMSFIMKQGESKEVYILIDSPPSAFYSSVDENGFITFDGSYDASLKDLYFIQENMYSLNFIISVPRNAELGIYTQDIIMINGNVQTMSVSIDVKHDLIVDGLRWFNEPVDIIIFQTKMLTIFLFFIFVSMLVTIFLLFNSVRNK